MSGKLGGKTDSKTFWSLLGGCLLLFRVFSRNRRDSSLVSLVENYLTHNKLRIFLCFFLFWMKIFSTFLPPGKTHLGKSPHFLTILPQLVCIILPIKVLHSKPILRNFSAHCFKRLLLLTVCITLTYKLCCLFAMFVYYDHFVCTS